MLGILPSLTYLEHFFRCMYITLLPGTHDILNATFSGSVIQTIYLEHTSAHGALFIFMFIDGQVVDFSKSCYLALNRNSSLQHVLLFSLYPGDYQILVFDIEEDGTLLDGLGYPAVTIESSVSENGQGILSMYLSVLVCPTIIVQ